MNYRISQRIIKFLCPNNKKYLVHVTSAKFHGFHSKENRNFFITNQLWRYHATLTPNSNSVTVIQMKQFLNEQGIGFLEGYTCLIINCQHCMKRKTTERAETSKIFINIATGSFSCIKCLICGTWKDFQDIVLLSKRDKRAFESFKKKVDCGCTKEELQLLSTKYESAIPITSNSDFDIQSILNRFGIQELNNGIFEKYGGRIIPDKNELLLPIYAYKKSFVGLHLLKCSDDSNELETVVLPRSLKNALFGYQFLNTRQDSVVITRSPLDTLALAQESKTNVVSLPHVKNLPLELLPFLESFKRIILWLDTDVSMWHTSKMFARKLNEKRCLVIRPTDEYLTPYECIKKNIDINDILKRACPFTHRAITTFQSLRQDVFAELSQADKVTGVKWKRFPLLNKLLKGHRQGELTIFTGPTGSGKTTFMSEYSLDLCIQGVRTLWGSFEIKNTRLAKIMLLQFAQTPTDKFLNEFEDWANKFESLPLFFLTFHGPESVKNVLGAMKHAVYIHDIEHVVVDNLQFMMGTPDAAYGSHDRFWKQDLVITMFREFATVHNCHVTLVIHPRKEDSDELTNMSIFGGAKAIQEADNVLILQKMRLNNLRARKFIQVTKNRFDGALGLFPLEFDGETRSFALKKEKTKES